MTPAAVLAIVVEASTKAAQAELMKMDASMRASAATAAKANASTAASFAATGKKMQSAGKTLTHNVTLPIVAIGAAAIKTSMDFHRSMTLIQTQAGASAKEVEKMSGAIVKFAASGQTDQGPKALADGLYAIESAGIRGARAMKTLRASSKLAMVGQADFATTTKALVAAQKTGIKGSANLNKEIGTLNATVGAGQMHMEDLVAAMGTGFLGAATQVGLKLPDVGAALAELTKQGVPASSAATRLRMTFTNMAAPSAAAATALKGIGLSSTDMARTMRGPTGLVGTLQLLQNHLDGLSKVKQTQVLAQAFGGAKSGGTIMQLLHNLGDLNTTLDSVHKNSDKVNKSFAAAKAQSAEELKIAWAQLQSALVKLGDVLIPIVIPAIQKLASWIGKLSDWFHNLSPAAQKAVEIFVALAAALGPVLRLVGWFLSPIGKLIAGIRGLTLAAREAGTVGAVGIKGFLGAFGAAAAAAVAMDQLNKQFSDAADMRTKLETIAPALDAIKSGAALTTSELQSLNKVGWTTGIGAQIDKLRATYGNLAAAAGTMSKAQRTAWVDMASTAAHNGDITVGVANELIKAMGVSSIRINHSLDSISTGAKDMASSISGSLDKVLQATDQKLAAAARIGTKHMHELFNGVSGSVTNLAHSVQAGLQNIGDNVDKALKGLGGKKISFGLTTAGQGVKSVVGKQHGGIIPGAGNGDKVHVMAEPGEGFLNKTFMKSIGGAKGLDYLNALIPRFATGGIVLPGAGVHRSYPMLSGDTDFIPALGAALSNMAQAQHQPISVTSGFRTYAEQAALYARYGPGRAASPGTSNHERGSAADISPGSSMFGGIAKRFGLAFDVPGESWHVDLVKALLGGGARGTVAKIQNIARQVLTGPDGALKSIGQGALDKTRTAANAFLQKQAGSGSFAGITGGGSVAANEALGRKMMLAAGWGASEWPSLLSLWMQESGWNANAVNPSSGAYGIPQSLGHGHPYNLGDAKAQIAWGLNYIRQRYGDPNAAWAHEQSAGWYQKGGVVGLAKGGAIAPSQSGSWFRKPVHSLHRARMESHDIARLTEQIDLATRRAALPASPDGTSMSESERQRIRGLDVKLLHANLLEDAALHQAMKQTRRYGGKGWQKRYAALHKRLLPLEGITGHGGSIFDAREAIAGLAKPGLDFSAQAGITSQFFDFLRLLGPNSFSGAFAAGGRVNRGGFALVGERGPELARLPAGTQVHSNAESRSMLSPEIHLHFAPGTEWLRDFVEVTIGENERAGGAHYRAGRRP